MTQLGDYLTSTETTDATLADKVGCDRSMITKIKNGKTMPSLPLAVAISRETGVPIEALMPHDPEPPVESPAAETDAPSLDCTSGAAVTGPASSSSRSPSEEAA